MTGKQITLNDLFCATKEIELPQELKGQARALSDGEIKERRRYAILHSQKATEEIKDESSDAYRLTIAPLRQEKQKDVLIDVLVQVRRVGFVRDAIQFIPNVMIPLPDDATDAQEREILVQRTAQDEGVQDARAAFVARRLTEVRKKYKALPLNKLRQMATQAVVAVYEQAASIDAVQYYTVYAGVFVYHGDKLARLYPDPDSVSGSPERVVDRLFIEVEEVSAIDPWEIAKNV